MSANPVFTTAPNLNLNPEEKRVYGQLFRQADTESVGVVTGEIAVKFFEKTRLDSRILGEIWQISDRENRGFLEPVGFGIALRLIGHAQAGREPSQELALQQGPLPRFDGINIAPAAPPPAPAPLQTQGSGLQAQATGGGPLRIPPLTPEKVSQYASLFERQSLMNGGLLPGDQAKNIFEKSGLPNEALGRIWQLADTEQRGALVVTEFVIAMHLLTSMKGGTLRGLPNILPAALYEAATRRGAAPRQSPVTTGPPISAIPRQLSGTAQPRTSSPLGRPPFSPQGTGIPPQLPPQVTGIPPQATSIHPQATGSDWLVTPADKVRFDQFYADLDKTNKGFITGEEAVPFLSQSGLSEDALAQIWDLADFNSQGQLNKDTFAVAMYLIRQQRSKRDLPLPTALPPNLIPPSMRNHARPALGPSPFDAPAPAPPQPPPQPKSALEDLFGLDTAPAPRPPQAALSPQGTGASRGGGPIGRDPFAGGKPASPVQPSPTGNTFKPFIPSSSFGRTLAHHDTGGSGTSAQKSPSAMDDLLGDNDPEASKNITNESTELANLSNQVGSLSKQMQQVQGQRSSTQNEINQASEQKQNFEARLSQLRTLYEKEANDVRTLEEQLRNIREETKKLTGEMLTIDGTYQDLQTQHQQLAQALQVDQQENVTLKQRMSSVNAEIAQLKPQIEKLKSEARQQKGLVAINKKQLSTVEGERDKLQTEVEDLTKSNEEMARQVNASSPKAAYAQVASPALSTASGNNPFFRRTGSSDIMGTFSSPPMKSYNDKSFDDIFGNFGTSSISGPPPPPTSFKQQNTGASTASVGSGSFGTPAGSTPTAGRQDTLNEEPPASSESRQLNSSYLPFGDAAGSMSSSRQVSPPLSRTGEGPGTSSSVPAPLEPSFTGQSVTSASNKSSASVYDEQTPSATVNDSIPGAFPDDTPTNTAPPTSFGGNRGSDPFGNMKNTGNAKVDFDSAFASFANSSAKPQEKPAKEPSNAFSSFNTEFPPISELERDDESDSASEGNKFDDDFAPASPAEKKVENSETRHFPSSPSTTKSDVPAAEGATTKTHSSQPSNLSLSNFPEPPKSPPAFSSSSKDDDPFAPVPTTTTNTAPVAPKGAFDDLDDDFEDLEDAKEGSADDEFANMSRSNLDDFNPVFDSSPPPSHPKTESTNVSNAFGTEGSYDFGTVSSTSAATAGGSGATPAANNVNPAPSSSQGPAAPENHDWDAIFASLDSPNDTTADRKSGEEAKSPVQNLSPERPNMAGRALTQEGKHDDPILKNLTGMGYSRTDALNALEKYDYNLERAANFLASHS
ncbi:Uu.00g073690.m01.CDS01 [Anthostomella pinea]|uniref:Uu.00g073690.m01.CDS01 n=1 Tax=Anthostomella pinea TaxID=933095 RepID=A0AAI8VW29_9PEZI|nr:Uu.00g073690.m01.CDS01 [Anthostomella pinea]